MSEHPEVVTVAKFDGHCEFCGKPIHTGEEIALSEANGGWVHLDCWYRDRIVPDDTQHKNIPQKPYRWHQERG